MERTRQRLTHATDTSNLADILERVLDKGIVIAGLAGRMGDGKVRFHVENLDIDRDPSGNPFDESDRGGDE